MLYVPTNKLIMLRKRKAIRDRANSHGFSSHHYWSSSAASNGRHQHYHGGTGSLHRPFIAHILQGPRARFPNAQIESQIPVVAVYFTWCLLFFVNPMINHGLCPNMSVLCTSIIARCTSKLPGGTMTLPGVHTTATCSHNATVKHGRTSIIIIDSYQSITL